MKSRFKASKHQPVDPSIIASRNSHQTLEEHAKENLELAEKFLRPIHLVLQQVNEVISDTLKHSSSAEDSLLKHVSNLVRNYANVETAALQVCLASEETDTLNEYLTVNEHPSGIITVFGSRNKWLGKFLLDRSPTLPPIELERRKRCVIAISKALERFPILFLHARLANIFERATFRGLERKIKAFDRFLNKAHVAIIHLGQRQKHIGVEIYNLSIEMGRKLKYYDGDSLGRFIDPATIDRPSDLKHKHNHQGSASNNFFIISFTTFSVFLSMLLGYFAWSDSSLSQARGRVTDPSFWDTCQNVVFQGTSIVVFLMADLRKDVLPLKAKYWAWVIVGVTVASSVASIPLYLRVSTKYSSMAGVAAAVGQSILSLQLPLAWIPRNAHQKTA